MKKIFFSLLGLSIFFVLFFHSPTKILAACTGLDSTGQCPSGYGTYCSYGAYCCDSQASCPAPPSTTPQSGGSGNSTSVLCNGTGISTAIGCIDVLGSQSAFLGAILRWAVGIGGGIAFLLIVYAGFMIMTSAGNPERLKAGQELLTSAISGLILLIFSVFILKFIGIDILGLNQFGF